MVAQLCNELCQLLHNIIHVSTKFSYRLPQGGTSFMYTRPSDISVIFTMLMRLVLQTNQGAETYTGCSYTSLYF